MLFDVVFIDSNVLFVLCVLLNVRVYLLIIVLLDVLLCRIIVYLLEVFVFGMVGINLIDRFLDLFKLLKYLMERFFGLLVVFVLVDVVGKLSVRLIWVVVLLLYWFVLIWMGFSLLIVLWVNVGIELLFDVGYFINIRLLVVVR